MTYTKFKNLSNDEKIKLINLIKHLYLDELYNRASVAEKIHSKQGFLKIIFKEYGIKKTKEQFKLTMENTCMKKYGVKSTNQLESIKKKQQDTCFKHHGVYSPLKLDTNRNKLAYENGYDNVFQMPEIKDLIKKRNKERYGVEFSIQRPEIKEKVKQTNIKRYGYECAMNAKTLSPEWQNNYKEKYGVTWPAQRSDFKEKVSNTCQKKYGVKWYCMSPDCRLKAGAYSKINQRFANLLNENNINYEQEFNLDNYSYDFKIENMLVEINPTYTHNSSQSAIFRNSTHQFQKTNKNYHFEKSKFAQNNGYFCIHIWDWDNWNKIINLFKDKKIIYARNCKIKEVKKKEADEFLNLYHLQNTCRGQKICYGLYLNDKLIQIMTFGKPRYNKNYEWELLRLCSHKDYKIVGGSERLFKHFLRELNPHNVISYCDNSKFSGDVYERLGMKLESFGEPSCNWSKGKERITNNLLMQRGYDQLFKTNYGKGTSNKDLMIQNGWREVYDCGQSTWIMINN